MPSFWGCRCCGAPTIVAAGDVNGWVRLIRNKRTKWYHDIGTTNALTNVAVVDQHTIAAIDKTKAYVIDSTGVTYSLNDNPGIPGGRAEWASGLRARDGKIYVIAGPPYRANLSLSVEITYPVTWGIAKDMTRVHDCEVDSNGAMYIIGDDVGNPVNPPQYMLRKFDSSGSSEWDILRGDYSAATGQVKIITIDDADNIYIFVRVDFLDGSHQMQIEKRTPSGSIVWATSHADMSIRAICYGDGFLWARASSGVFEKFDASNGSLVATYSSLSLANSFFKADPNPKKPFLILGTTSSDVGEVDPLGPTLRWTSGNSLGTGISSLDAKFFPRHV